MSTGADNFEHEDMASAAMEHCRRHTRRIDLRMFKQGAREMSLGLKMHLTEGNIRDLFTQADSDKDGYITFLDALRAMRAPVPRWQKLKQREWADNMARSVEVQEWNKLVNQGVLSLTWRQVAERVQTRGASLTYGFAGDVHHIVDNRVKAPFAVFEVASRRRAAKKLKNHLAGQ